MTNIDEKRAFQELMTGPSDAFKADLWRAKAMELADKVDRMQAERLKLDRRIHNQRMSLRQNWEIVEMRRNYMGSPASRAAYARLLKRHQALLAGHQ